MNFKRLGIIAALFTVFSFQASASIVSFLIVETGLRSGSPDTQYTSLWEGGLMNAFFDAGHIVTNSPITRMETRPDRDLSGTVEVDFRDAVRGGAEFFILGFLEYQAGNAVPSGITLKIYKTGSQQIVYEQRFQAGAGKSLSEEYQIAQNAGRAIASHLKDR
jgi:hypothetical protein